MLLVLDVADLRIEHHGTEHPHLITYQWFRCLKASKTNDQARHCFCVRTKSAPVVQTEPQCWSSALADCLSNLILGHADCGCRRSSPTTILPFAEMQKPIIITDNNKKTYRYPLGQKSHAAGCPAWSISSFHLFI